MRALGVLLLLALALSACSGPVNMFGSPACPAFACIN